MARAPIAERPIHENEAAVVRWMLQHASTTGPLEHLITSISTLHVVDCCRCGCPSVDFQPNGQSGDARPIADAVGVSPEGFEIGIMVWGNAGAITGLEVYNFGDEVPFSLPKLETLRLWEQRNEKA
jgi:hypothetical protein